MSGRRKWILGLALAAAAFSLQIKGVYADIAKGGAELVNLVPAFPEPNSAVLAALFLLAAFMGIISLGKRSSHSDWS